MRDFKLHLPGRMLCRISPRFHLRMICRAIGLEPYVWQRAFALGRISSLPGKRERGNGKTTAVMLRLLMLPKGTTSRDAKLILNHDPGFRLVTNHNVLRWYEQEYRTLRIRCVLARVPVSDLGTSVFHSFMMM